VPTNHRLMDTPPEAASAETRRMLKRWGALHAGRSALGLAGALEDPRANPMNEFVTA
jgi:hypothetical protein